MTSIKKHSDTRNRFLYNHIDELLDASFDGIVIADALGNIIFTNRAYEELSGINRTSLTGKNLKYLINSGVLEGAVVLDVTKTRVQTTKAHYYTKTNRMAMVTANPVFDEKGKLQVIIANFRDVTQLHNWYAELGHLEEENFSKDAIFLKSKLANLPNYGMLIQNDLMMDCLNKALRVAKFDTHILILGESGTGKTKLTDIIHQQSARSQGPFISINCGSIPEHLLESEFYGYERGAFTGARTQGKKGLFEVATGGTLVLDEISELSMGQQVKLLKALDEGEIYKVGGEKPIHVDVRIIAVTNRDLKNMVQENLFRQDLYFRLNVVPLCLPSLRERPDEIPLLVKFFFHEFNNKYGTSKYPTPNLIRHLCRLEYPGNVRELKNLVERLVVLSSQSKVSSEDLQSFSTDTKEELLTNYFSYYNVSLEKFLETCERDAIKKITKESKTLREAARLLGISKVSLWRKLKKHNIGRRVVIQHDQKEK